MLENAMIHSDAIINFKGIVKQQQNKKSSNGGMMSTHISEHHSVGFLWSYLIQW